MFEEKRLIFERSIPEKKMLTGHPEATAQPESGKEKHGKTRAELLQKKKDERKAFLDVVREQNKNLSPEQLKLAKEYIKKYTKEEIESMLLESGNMTIYDLRRGGALRLANENDKNLKKNQGYAEMTSQFAKQGVDKNGKFHLVVDLKGKDKYEENLGAGHICPPSWVKVVIEDTNGIKRTGFRKIPGTDNVQGEKIGYYTENGEYLVIYSNYKIYPVEVKTDTAQNKKEMDFYKKKPSVTTSEPRPSEAVTPLEASSYTPDATKQQMIDRGSTPFAVRMGYRLTPEEARWYNDANRQAYKLSKLDVNRRLDYFQQNYKLMDALKHSADMLGIQQKDWNYFLAMNDATLHVESNYNVFAFNRKRSGDSYQVTASTAAGEYQILNSVWREMKKYNEDSPQGKAYRAQMRKIGIDPEKFAQLDLSAPKPEFSTPAQRAAVFNFFNFRYSRLTGKLESIDKIYDNIRSTSGRTRSSWMRVIYTYWRNGPNGAAPFIRNLRNGVPLPETREEAMDYFNNHLTDRDWQKRRGFSDFWMLIRATKKYEGRFQKNLNELGES